MLVTHRSGVRVLLSPTQPEQAERVTTQHVAKLIEALSDLYDYVLIDCNPGYDDRNLQILERSDDIMFVIRPELGPLRNMGVFFNVASKLDIPHEKIHIVLNRADLTKRLISKLKHGEAVVAGIGNAIRGPGGKRWPAAFLQRTLIHHIVRIREFLRETQTHESDEDSQQKNGGKRGQQRGQPGPAYPGALPTRAPPGRSGSRGASPSRGCARSSGSC